MIWLAVIGIMSSRSNNGNNNSSVGVGRIRKYNLLRGGDGDGVGDGDDVGDGGDGDGGKGGKGNGDDLVWVHADSQPFVSASSPPSMFRFVIARAILY